MMGQTEAGRMQAGGGMRPYDEPDKPFGPVAAVFLAAGFGALVLGILTTVAEASEDFKSALEWAKSVGSLSGKTLIASAVFLVAWGILYLVLREKDPSPRQVFLWTGIMVAIAIVLTFPTFFQIFAPEE
jgi:hypothetical protein